MKTRRVKMSLAEYHRLPFSLAWKQEYINGSLVESPRDVIVYAAVPVEPRAAASRAVWRPVRETDERALAPLFRAAFAECIEFCDYTPKRFVQFTSDCLHRFFHDPARQVLSASRVALGPSRTGHTGKPIGAALVTLRDEGYAMLDMIFVLPPWQRQGIATALAVASLNALHALGGYRAFVSRYHLGNEASAAWHHRFGFVEEPDLRLAQLRLRAAQHEFRRHSQLGTLSPEIQDKLDSECEHWREEAKRLEAALKAGRKEEAFPGYKWQKSEAT